MTIETAVRAPDWQPPTRLGSLVFGFKQSLLSARRSLINAANGPRRLPKDAAGDFPVAVAASRAPLRSSLKSVDARLEQGKIQNLRMAARALDGVLLPAGEVFSFWAQVGRTSTRRGYVAGRMIQEGCMVASTGGGLCQLSNALYDSALKAGLEIVERHAHSRIVPGSAAARGRDATIAWNYVDLRFRSAEPLLLKVKLSRDELAVEFFGKAPVETKDAPVADEPDLRATAESCDTCDETDCFRHAPAPRRAEGRTAFLVDARWPEFDAFIQQERGARDILCLPMDGAAWRRPQYGWNKAGFGDVVTATFQTLLRGYESRKLAQQGAERQRALLRHDEKLAARFAREMTAEVEDICVMQNLLPFLWRNGDLGGRRFRVLMTRLPLKILQGRLDTAAARHPESATLSDFRADPGLVAAEWEALQTADCIVTPHREIAALFGARAILLDWTMPEVAQSRGGTKILFAGPTVGRKGAYEMRNAAWQLDLEVTLLGKTIEGDGFWKGFRTMRADPANPLKDVGLVVHPALVEDQPRRLLRALAAGIPVIATRACGLPEQDGLTLVPEGDADALARAISASTLYRQLHRAS